MSRKLKVLTVVGTRPEIIRLSSTIKLLDDHTDHVLVHTGQNYDYELNQVFFEDLGLKQPRHFLNADTSTLGSALGSILSEIESVIAKERPDAFLVLGDTNSCISAVMAKRMGVPVFHMEAGNRSYDENVPEETNRRLVDHISDYNLVYTEHARRNLLSEGIHASRILLTGSPMNEVLTQNKDQISKSKILEEQDLVPQGYFLVSLHRQENVDNDSRLKAAIQSLEKISETYNLPVLVSTHPRTKKQLEKASIQSSSNLIFHAPFGFHDYIYLQQNAKLVVSDSGTISEESTLLNFPAVTIRDFIERPEAQDTGSIITTGLNWEDVLNSVEIALSLFDDRKSNTIPHDYAVEDTSKRVLSFIRSTAHSHHARLGLRR
ncbi:UDP-N-acetylglucosamine 2-epimerase [Corynebacterium suranareeae]|uniref:UDP-N-acetylglucosamine 2-epimerase n=1 Tax=Corynebacterium suranareeae TaxID=2506452 RepID=A0A160PN37_9CORY|nr:UDP-N-acetylglucosamine 2-epimerase (non-hydrolyzing) [Corynebacterium suranareeae]BAU94754.1 UDP-N-acetylglucosamine 2-epimerase [Corynebacterium suranareeae]